MAEREAGVARSAQHIIHVLPHAPTVVARFLAPALERVTADADATQVLVITPDGDTALAIADIARSLSTRSATQIVPITASARGGRLLASRVTPAIAATPSTLVSLLRSSAVKLDAVRAVVLAWADELFDAREEEPLEIVLAEIPKEATRIVVTDRLTPQVEALVERHFRRALRQGAESTRDPIAELPIRYVTTPSSGRRAALRRLLDELDPPSVIVLASDEALEEARATVASLGYEGDALVRVESAPVAEQAALVVFYDLPVAADQVAKVAESRPAQVVALVAPRQVPALRRLTAGAVEPLDVSQVGAKARARDERVRSALRAELQNGFPAREVMALEPLLAEFDGLEIAAAALRLIERDRADNRARRADAERPVERASERPVERASERTSERTTSPAAERPAARGEAGYTRVFLSIGDRDGVTAGNLVGAITGESGITSDRIGKLEIRDSHTVAEIAAADAALVVEKMNGVSIKGRRLTARVDDRPAPRGREGGRTGGRESRGGEGARGFRGASRGGPREGGRGGFGAPRRERPSREGGGREGGPRERGARDDRGREGGGREGRPPRGPGRDRPSGSDRRPRGDDARPRARSEFRDRSEEGRIPRATREREEWTERADRVRNAKRPRRDDA